MAPPPGFELLCLCTDCSGATLQGMLSFTPLYFEEAYKMILVCGSTSAAKLAPSHVHKTLI